MMDDYPRIGVGVIVLNSGNQVLLGKRLSTHGQGFWAFPGGHLEPNESVAECAKREVWEETQIQLKEVGLGPFSYDEFEESGRRYVTLFCIARIEDQEPTVCEPAKCESWEWFSWDALPQPLFKPIQSLIIMLNCSIQKEEASQRSQCAARGSKTRVWQNINPSR